MSCYLNLLRPLANTRQAFRCNRSFITFHQCNRSSAVSRKNETNFFIKRLKSNDSLQNKPVEEVKVQKVKLKVSDLKRLLSLAKTEKWKIGGIMSFVQRFEFFMAAVFSIRSDRVSHSFVLHHDGSSLRVGQDS